MPIPGMKPEAIFPGRDKCSNCGGFYDTADMYPTFPGGRVCELCMEAMIEEGHEAAAEQQYMQQRQGGYGT